MPFFEPLVNKFWDKTWKICSTQSWNLTHRILIACFSYGQEKKWFSVQSIRISSFSTFLSIFGDFDTILLQMWSEWLELSRERAMCRRHNHWRMFAPLRFFQKVIFQEMWKRHFFGQVWALFTPQLLQTLCIKQKMLETLVTLELQRICNNHEYHTIFTLWWHTSKEQIFKFW